MSEFLRFYFVLLFLIYLARWGDEDYVYPEKVVGDGRCGELFGEVS